MSLNGNQNGENRGAGEMHQLLGFVPTRIFLTVNHATLVVLKESLVWLGGLRKWSQCFLSTIGINEAYEMPWKELVKLMIEVYCPRNAIQKLENKLWNLCVKRNDVAGYTMANGLMDQKVRVYATRNAEQQRKFNNKPWGNHIQQPPFKRQNIAQAIMVGNSKKRGYVGSAPYYNKCRLYHEGPCTVNCTSCKKVGHMARNQNYGNKAANNDSYRGAYALRGGDGNPDSNVITGILLVQQVKFQIDLVPGATPVARAPYRHMTKFTQKSVKYEWVVKEEVAFQLLNQKLCSAPILVLPEGSENFVVYCDASCCSQELDLLP
uniref:Putative reverse transcriptase domain-containing protein n=1 Tax=Tanacetum cinerariifolium TaxID=118510 RepID=A0A6L2LX48_TANCI|nr:putative reverse transcriptase domain-containing protein [Tanacetum cinerariifolium]